MGFLVICSGVILLQLAKSSKDVPDTAVFKGDLDQVRTVAEQAEPESEPRADTIRGGAGIVRAMSRVRTMRQASEARRIYEESLQPIGENGETFEWDGLRRRRTMSTLRSDSVQRQKPVHPPLGMTHFPDDDEDENNDADVQPGFFSRFGMKSKRSLRSQEQVPLESVQVSPYKLDPEPGDYTYSQIGLAKAERPPGGPPGSQGSQSLREDTAYHGSGSQHVHFATAGDAKSGRRDVSPHTLAPPKLPPHVVGSRPESSARRQFSFQNVFQRKRSDHGPDDNRPTSRGGLSFISGRSGTSSHGGRDPSYPGTAGDGATEEERAGLVHGRGDSTGILPIYNQIGNVPEAENERDSDEIQQLTPGTSHGSPQEQASGVEPARARRRDSYEEGDHDEYKPCLFSFIYLIEKLGCTTDTNCKTNTNIKCK